jgi:hypothetical protein
MTKPKTHSKPTGKHSGTAPRAAPDPADPEGLPSVKHDEGVYAKDKLYLVAIPGNELNWLVLCSQRYNRILVSQYNSWKRENARHIAEAEEREAKLKEIGAKIDWSTRQRLAKARQPPPEYRFEPSIIGEK